MRRSYSTALAHQVSAHISQAKQRDESQPKPQVQILWHDPQGFCKVKFLPWRHPCTDEALSEWIDDYFDMLKSGYCPEGFSVPPVPHCARVLYRGRVLAEWHLRPSFSAESHVTADEREGPAGMPAAPPSAPCSECLAVPTQSVPRREDSDGIDRDPPKSPDSNRAVLTTG